LAPDAPRQSIRIMARLASLSDRRPAAYEKRIRGSLPRSLP
jgi:hypothetical protein